MLQHAHLLDDLGAGDMQRRAQARKGSLQYPFQLGPGRSNAPSPHVPDLYGCFSSEKPTIIMVTLLCGGVLSERALRLLLTRGIVKTSGFTRGVSKIGDFNKFKGFLVESS